ncbi:hypothetical protein LC087_09915 [Bacillus carboniphilus]|uniref:Uncharacterized protein n=1 Tax=Bacillus carboniphilus TaxID=86663 RepID=A0ABY9JPC5_9BACI|nr:hypothetical protein [Bacillus carboniphilus]WLR41256.1 hypothetical protein LC087_09915 [Bacillus carboniphilus]
MSKKKSLVALLIFFILFVGAAFLDKQLNSTIDKDEHNSYIENINYKQVEQEEYKQFKFGPREYIKVIKKKEP